MKSEILYSIVIPVFNSERSVGMVCKKIDKVFSNLGLDYEIILVDDCSRDGSWDVLKKLNQENKRIKCIKLMRNFGEHNAVMTGLNHAGGDFVTVMDDDGQNPPEEVPKLIEKINEGYDVVFGNYKRKKHHWFRNVGSAFNDRVANILLRKPHDLYLCSFKIIRRSLVDEVVKYDGPYPYIDGLIFRSTRNIGVVLVEHKEREAGKSGYSFSKLIALWLNMFTNFSILPLRLATFIGLAASSLGFIMAVYFVLDKIIHPATPMGWASTIVAILLFAGIQLLVLGMIGEYLGRLFLYTNKTPQYIIREKIGFN